MNKGARRAHLAALRDEPRTLVFYEAPHKLTRTLTDLLDALGDREVALCRELTKLHEEVWRGTLSEAAALYTKEPPRGEFVLVVAGAPEPEKPAGDFPMDDPLLQVETRLAAGESLKDAVRVVSRAQNLPRNALYRAALARFAGENPADEDI
jgi:16S rRNA (cytidine1402-2'-O)-methyltransferase